MFKKHQKKLIIIWNWWILKLKFLKAFLKSSSLINSLTESGIWQTAFASLSSFKLSLPSRLKWRLLLFFRVFKRFQSINLLLFVIFNLSLFTLLTKKRAKIINLLNEEANASTSSATGNNENDAQSDAFKSASSSPQGSQDLVSISCTYY